MTVFKVPATQQGLTNFGGCSHVCLQLTVHEVCLGNQS